MRAQKRVLRGNQVGDYGMPWPCSLQELRWDRTHEYMEHEPHRHRTCHPARRFVHLVLLWRHVLVRVCDADYTINGM